MQKEKQTIVAGGITQSAVYNFKKIRNKELVQKELKSALAVLLKNNVDLIILEVRWCCWNYTVMMTTIF